MARTKKSKPQNSTASKRSTRKKHGSTAKSKRPLANSGNGHGPPPPPPSNGEQGNSQDAEGSDSSDEDIVDREFLQRQGRIVGRCCDLYDLLEQPLEEGIAHYIRKEDLMTTDLDDHRRRTYDYMVDQIPRLVDILSKLAANEQLDTAVVTEIADDLASGRQSAKGEDVKMFKQEIHGWIKEWHFPRSRVQAGFQHDDCGRYLCPVNLDWGDLAVRARLRKQAPGPDEPPAFLWESFKITNDKNLYEGYLQNTLLVTAMIALFISRKLAKGESKAAKPSIAEAYGIVRVTVPMIAYVATLLRFVLSNQENFLPGPGNVGVPDDDKLLEDAQSSWPYRKFYYSIIETVEKKMKDKTRKQLLKWWNTMIFPATSGSSISAPPAPTSFLAQMHAQGDDADSPEPEPIDEPAS